MQGTVTLWALTLIAAALPFAQGLVLLDWLGWASFAVCISGAAAALAASARGVGRARFVFAVLMVLVVANVLQGDIRGGLMAAGLVRFYLIEMAAALLFLAGAVLAFLPSARRWYRRG